MQKICKGTVSDNFEYCRKALSSEHILHTLYNPLTCVDNYIRTPKVSRFSHFTEVLFVRDFKGMENVFLTQRFPTILKLLLADRYVQKTKRIFQTELYVPSFSFCILLL